MHGLHYHLEGFSFCCAESDHAGRGSTFWWRHQMPQARLREQAEDLQRMEEDERRRRGGLTILLVETISRS